MRTVNLSEGLVNASISWHILLRMEWGQPMHQARFRKIARLFHFLLLGPLLLGVGLPQAANAAKYKILHQFCADQNTCPDGYVLAAPLVRGPDGSLYGTAVQGGATFFG